MIKSSSVSLLFAIFLMLCDSSLALSPFAPRGKGLVGPKVGILSRADIKAGDETYTSKINISIGLFFDVPVAGNFYSGLATDFDNISVLDQQQFFLDVSIPIKYAIRHGSSGMVIKPAVAVGLGHLAGITFMDATNYLTVKAFVELHYPMPKNRAWVLELGVLDTPTGGNSKVDASIGPIVYLRVGYVL